MNTNTNTQSEMTKQTFDQYRRVQYGGKTNMFDVNAVVRLSHNKLTRADCMDIMQNYDKYTQTYGEYER